ncbi:hypothetical protein MMB75_25365 [Paenibacillus sp. P2(2022)]|uniref:hypothetical protein n=1 Tax=Paenibacillus sp. P2(2022) TaxID=2917813 RepID=UPI00240652B0|nr:hypothetical protein [Paenibacillus sp. P2(2022)]MDG0056958.1 hypothetical protein [Paenibacillus sp. P2(2022)]
MKFSELIQKCLESDSLEVQVMNNALMELSKKNRRRPGFIKFAVPDETADRLMLGGDSPVAMMVLIDRDKFNSITNGLGEDTP